MRLKISLLCSATLSAAALLSAAPPLSAQMVPIQDQRIVAVQAVYQGVVDSFTVTPTPFAFWGDEWFALAEKYEACENPPPDSCLVGSASSFAFQYSQFWPAAIQFSGGCSGQWGIPPSGSYGFLSNAGFTFRVDTTFSYELYAEVDPGDWPSKGTFGGAVSLFAGGGPGITIHRIESGILQVTGRLGPGVYTFEGWSSGGHLLESFQGAVYSGQWTTLPVPDPIIDEQPDDLTLACGDDAVFTAGTVGLPSNYTFQWRYNGIPLTNGGDVSGATSATLVLTSICVADSGQYDVVVTGVPPGGGSPVSEPSRMAHLGIITGVGADPVAEPAPAVLVRAVAPNPFHASTSVRYEAPGPGRLRATVYNVAGAEIRTIVDDEAASSGVVTWDGRQGSGARAPGGIYFIRLEMGGARVTRKVVLTE